MDELERTAVQLAEADRLATFNDVAHVRLALLLLDNAAETSLMRSSRALFIHAEMYENMGHHLSGIPVEDGEGQRLKAEIDSRRLSRRRRRQIERNFDDLVDYVFDQKDSGLDSSFAECLKTLHRYRNAAYHRDTIQRDVLKPAVEIYFFLCCHLLKAERDVLHQIDAVPPSVAEIFGAEPPECAWPGGAADSASLGRDLADFFLRNRGLDHASASRALSGHLLARLDTLDHHLATIGENVPPGLSRPRVLQLVQQLPTDPEDFDKPAPKDFWTRKLPVTEAVVSAWRARATSIGGLAVAHDALRSFAELERELERLEDPVGRFIDDLDRAEQRAIDELRGK